MEGFELIQWPQAGLRIRPLLMLVQC